MVSFLIPPGADSFSTLYQPNPSPSTGEQIVTNPQIANNTVTPPIDTTIVSQPYNFTLGTPAGANDPTAVSDGGDAVYPLDDGEPEYSPSEASVYVSLGADAAINPADLDPSVFAGWSQLQQQIYLQSWGLTQAAIGTNVNGGVGALYAGTPSSGAAYMTTTLTSWALEPMAAVDATLTPNTSEPSLFIDGFAAAQGVSQATAINQLSVAPANLDPSVFASWTTAGQSYYEQYWGLINNNGVTGAIGVNVNDGANAIVINNATSGPGVFLPLSAPISTWAQALGAALNAAGQSTPTPVTDPSPVDLNGYGGVPPADLDPSIFEQWTSEQQSEYMNYNGLQTAVIGSAVSGATPITAVLSQTTPDKVYIVENLQAADLADMSSADIALVASTAAWQNPVGSSLGYTTQNDPTTGLTPMQVVQGGITTDVNQIQGSTTPTYFSLTNLANSSDLPETIPASQVSTLNIPTQSSVTTDGAGGTILTSVSVNGNVTDVVQVIVNPSGTNIYSALYGNASYSNTTYTTNADGSVSVDSYLSVGTGTTSSTNPGSSPGAYAAYASITPDANSSESDISISYGGGAVPGVNSSLTQSVSVTSATPNAVTVTTQTNQSVNVYGMPAADRQVFIDELNLLSQQVAAGVVVNETQISSETSAIMQRFDQAAIYWSQYYPSTFPLTYGGVSGAVSTDNNAGIQQAYNTFIAQEKTILQSAQDAENLLSPSSTNSPDMDAPTAAMVALGTSMSSQQANIEIGTTALQQIQTLLQNVGTLQSLVNSTVTDLNGNTTNQVALGGANDGAVTPASGLTASQLAVAQMFSSNIAGANPILTEYGIPLPAMTLIRPDGSMPGYTSALWNTYGQSLANLVTELQQQAQTLTTNLNQETQQMNNTFTEMTGIEGQEGTVINTIGTDLD